MSNLEEITFHSSVETEERLYHWINERESLKSPSGGKIGSLEYKESTKDANLHLTSSIAVSPVMGKSFYVFATCVEKKRIEVWKSRNTEELSLTLSGYFHVPELESRSEIAIDFSSKHLEKILGDITYFTLYVSCPELSKIRYIAIPTQKQGDSMSDGLVFGTISNPELFQPTIMRSWTNERSSLLAVVSEASGDVFILQKHGWSYSLLQIIKHDCMGLGLPSTAIAWDDDSGRLYVANSIEVNSLKLDYNGQWTHEMSYTLKDFELTRIHCCRTESGNVLLASSTKQNRVVALENQQEKVPALELLGPCSVNHPMCIESIPHCDVVMIAERLSTAKCPLVSLFRLHEII